MLAVLVLVMLMVVYEQSRRTKRKIERIEVRHQRALSEVVAACQEKERARIALDLHDALLSKLSALKISMCTEGLMSGSEQLKVLQDSIEVGRNLTHELSPTFVDRLSLEELLHSLPSCPNYSLNLEVDDSEDRVGLKFPVKLHLFRIVQEVWNNMLKHAETDIAFVKLIYGKSSFRMDIEDRGKGFDVSDCALGMGLQNVKMRSDALGAKCEITSEVGVGTKIYVELNY